MIASAQVDSHAPKESGDRYWVIFDTSTRIDYYADVHNLLAMPRGVIMRYDYRRVWHSKAAEEAVFGASAEPDRLLLLYAQWTGFRKGDPDPPEGTPPRELIFVPTRLAQMVLVARSGDRAFFDFRVEGYPKMDQEALDEILGPLRAAGEVPYRKWVAISNRVEALNRLSGGSDDENWVALVDVLGAPPSQFAEDSFWRLLPPIRGDSELAVRDDERMRPAGASEPEIRQVTSGFVLLENQTCDVTVGSHTPRVVSRHSAPQRRLEVKPTSGVIQVVGDASIDLRQYTERAVRLKAARYEELETREGSVRFESHPSGDWPAGPAVSISFWIRKSRIKTAVAGALGLAAVAFGSLGASLVKDRPGLAAVWAAAAAVSLVCAGLVWTGKLKLSK